MPVKKFTTMTYVWYDCDGGVFQHDIGHVRETTLSFFHSEVTEPNVGR